MKILYDLIATQPNASGKSHGGGKYAIILFFEIIKTSQNIECFYDSSKYIREDILEECKKKSIKLHDIQKTQLEKVVLENKFDIFYSALPFYFPIITKTKTKYIGTIHGLRGIEMPIDHFFLNYKLTFKEKIKTYISLLFPKLWKKRMRTKTAKIMTQPNFSYIAVSNHSKHSILSYFPEVKNEEISVFYSPSTSFDYNIEVYSKESYFLMVSANRPEKNSLRALMALDELFTEQPAFSDKKVYITGASMANFKYKFKNKDKFICLGYVDEDILDSLYKGAFCFIYPSLNEGFGYPPLEAMHYGVPSLCSPLSSISEVCGDAVLYFNPFDYKEIKARILEITLNKAKYKDLENKAKIRYEIITQKQQLDLKSLVNLICNHNNI